MKTMYYDASFTRGGDDRVLMSESHLLHRDEVNHCVGPTELIPLSFSAPTTSPLTHFDFIHFYFKATNDS